MGNNFLNIPNGINIGSRSTDPVSNMKNGDVYFNTTVNKLKVYDGTIWKAVGSGSGGGGGSVNLLSLLDKNFDAEANTAGWVAYANTTPADRPETGTGGTPSGNLSLSRTTTVGEVLNGLGSFKLSKAAFNCQGEGYSMDIAVPLGFQGGVYDYSFMVKSSATFAAGAVVAYLYDITNSKLLQLTPFAINFSAGQKGRFKGSVQVENSCAAIRLILHVATNSATAFDLFLDDLSMGPSDSVLSTQKQVAAKYSLSSSVAVTAGNVIPFNSPVFDLDGLLTSSGVFTVKEAGYYFISTNVQAQSATQTSLYATVNGGSVGYMGQTAVANGMGGGATIIKCNIGDTVSIRPDGSQTYTGPDISFVSISLLNGFGSVFSDVVAAQLPLTSNYAVAAGAPIKFDTISSDSEGGYSPTTGLYTVSKSGPYHLSFTGLVSAGSSGPYIAKNGVAVVTLCSVTSSVYGSGSYTVNANAGDTLAIHSSSAVTFVGGNTQLSIDKVGGSSSSLIPRKIIAQYNNATGSFANPYNDVIYTNKVKDTNSAYNPATGEFICPEAGDYNLTASALINGTYSVNQAVEFTGVKNLSVVGRNQVRAGGGVTYMGITIDQVFADCLAGDVLKIQVLNQATSPSYTGGFGDIVIRKL